MDWFQPTLSWYLTTTAITLAIAPLVMMLFSSVTDRGASVIRPIGALLLTWPLWLLASIGDGLVPFSWTALWVALVGLATLAWLVGLRTGALTGASIIHVAIAEAGHLVAFAAYVWLHGFVPSVTGPFSPDQEKPSDLMMLASTMRAESMPPLDAWLSGETINYYYFGYVIWAGVANMIDTTPAIAFNLALASTFAMTVVAIVGTVANILSRFTKSFMARVGGALAVLLVVLSGNAWAAIQVLREPSEQWSQWPFSGIFWNATRIIQDGTGYPPISEFPAFSFLLADLHPHLLAIPYTITALAFAWLFASMPRDVPSALRWVILSVAGICVTALYAMNSWDYPTWWFVVACAILVSPAFRIGWKRFVAVGAMTITGLVAWLPFILAFETPVNSSNSALAETFGDVPLIGGVVASIATFTSERTSPIEYLSIFGFFYPVLLLALATELFAHRDITLDPLILRLAWLSAGITVLLGILMPAPLVIMLGLPILAGVVILLRSTNLTLGVITTALATLAFLLTLIPEFFYLLDVFGTRMNTVFKLYLQVWILSGVATALALALLWRRTSTWRPGQALVAAAALIIVLAGLTYPVFAGSQWYSARNPDGDWQGIDGLAFLQGGDAADPATYDALQWLWDNASEEDVLLAAGGCEWNPVIGRPAAASGVPSIIGWDGHETQWHLGDQEILSQIPERVDAIRDLFAMPTADLLDEYGVTLIFIGRSETQGGGSEPTERCAPGPFPEATSPEFPGPGWTEVFSQDGVRILRRDTAT